MHPHEHPTVRAALGLAYLRQNAAAIRRGPSREAIRRPMRGRVGDAASDHAAAVQNALERLGDANNVMMQAIDVGDVAGQTAAQEAQMQALADLAALGADAEQVPPIVPAPPGATPPPRLPPPTPGLPPPQPTKKTSAWKYMLGALAIGGLGYAAYEYV